jgi:methylated-DNA-protein-cysteine methyltransferase-like protein
MARETRKDNTSFFNDVWDVVRLVPYGRVTCYGAIASYLAIRGSARMVGWAMNASHTCTTDIPAHRVVNHQGLLTGKNHFGHPGLMQQLLESEGIEVVNDKVQRYRELFWDPAVELEQKL